ncbi:hypothetical protein HDV63DRAFT_378751, partial [Trichoderma sp. SZMC 28014]
MPTTISGNINHSLLRYMVIRNLTFTLNALVNNGNNARIVVRLSHLQNDGWFQEQILNASAITYNGVSLSNTPAFSSLLYNRAQDAKDSREYWRNLLAGTTGVKLSPTRQPAKFSPIRTLRTVALSSFHGANDNPAAVSAEGASARQV